MGGRLKTERVGEKYISIEGEEIEIIEYFSGNNSTVRFNKTGIIVKNKSYKNIVKGIIDNPFQRKLNNKGYIGEGIYVSKDINGLNNIYYEKWSSMFKRSYGSNDLPTYSECTVDDSWDCLQDFGVWFDENFKPWMDSSWDLDKDILKKGNKVYSSDFCCLVPAEINSLFINCKRARGKYPIGVYKKGNKFVAQISKNKNRVTIGSFITPEEAFQAYKIAKEEYIKEIANKWRGKISERCYQAMINYQVEITD